MLNFKPGYLHPLVQSFFGLLAISIYPWEKNMRKLYPSESCTLTRQLDQKQTDHSMMFRTFRQYRNVITGVTFRNISDKHTWLDQYPVPGRKNYPLLFDQNLQPKKGYWKVVNF